MGKVTMIKLSSGKRILVPTRKAETDQSSLEDFEESNDYEGLFDIGENGNAP